VETEQQQQQQQQHSYQQHTTKFNITTKFNSINNERSDEK